MTKSLDSDNDLFPKGCKKKGKKRNGEGVKEGRKERPKEGRKEGGREGGRKEKKRSHTRGAMSHVLLAGLYKICTGLNLRCQLKMLYYNTFKCLQNL